MIIITTNSFGEQYCTQQEIKGDKKPARLTLANKEIYFTRLPSWSTQRQAVHVFGIMSVW